MENDVNDDQKWRVTLIPEDYRSCSDKGSELPVSGEYQHTLSPDFGADNYG